jgi:uncharacterized membrane protein
MGARQDCALAERINVRAKGDEGEARAGIMGSPARCSCFHDCDVKGFLSDHPTLRGFLIIGVIAVVVVALSLQPTLAALFLLARIAFFLAIAFFVYLVWREQRSNIALWPRRAYAAFYGAAVLAIASLGVYFWRGASGLDAVAFLIILGLCGFSMWRVWRDQHTYG